MWFYSDEIAVNLNRFTHDGLLGDINKDDMVTKKFLINGYVQKNVSFQKTKS